MSSVPSVSPGVHPEDDRPVLWLRTPYHEFFVAQLKSMLPDGGRGWDPDRGAWWIDPEHQEEAEQLILAHWPDVLVVGEGGESDRIRSRDGTAVEQGRLL